MVGMQLYRMWIGKDNGCSLLLIETGFSQNVIESNKNFFVRGSCGSANLVMKG